MDNMKASWSGYLEVSKNASLRKYLSFVESSGPVKLGDHINLRTPFGNQECHKALFETARHLCPPGQKVIHVNIAFVNGKDCLAAPDWGQLRHPHDDRPRIRKDGCPSRPALQASRVSTQSSCHKPNQFSFQILQPSHRLQMHQMGCG
jgi:hypothetical protein